MSQTEVVTVLKVETGNSENSIKSIKKEISDLKKALEGAEIGSEAFEKASKDLADAQQRLKSVMDSTKQTVSAAEGSYDALVATMAKLKKEWRSTADEAKRNEIGKQIDAINTELKELDATLGNHQRNVGNYKGDIIDAYREIQGEVKKTNGVLAGSAKPIDDATDAAYDYGKELNELNKTTEVTRGALDGVGKMTSGVASGFAAVQGVIALCGVESEEFEKVMVKLTSAMAIAQGIGGLKGLVEGAGQLKTAFKAASQGAKIFGQDLSTLAKGAGATMLILAAFVEVLKSIYNRFAEAKKQQEEYQAQLNALKAKEQEVTATINSSIASRVVQFEILKNTWINLRTEGEKTKWIQDNQSEFNKLGISINSVADAQRVLIENSPKVITALQKQAEAAALQSVYQELYTKRYNLQSGITDLKVGDKPTDEQYEYLINSSNGFENSGIDVVDWERASGQILGGRMNPIYGLNQEGINKLVSLEITQLDTEIQDLVTKITTLTIEASQVLNDVNSQTTPTTPPTTPPTNNPKPTNVLGNTFKDAENVAKEAEAILKKIEEQAKGIAERTTKSVIDTKQEELDEIERIYKGEKALLEAHNIDTTNLTEEYYKNNFEVIKRYLGEEQNLITENSSFKERETQISYNTQALTLDENDKVGAIQLEIDKTLELQAIREQAFNEQMAQIKAILDAEKEKNLLSAEQEAELQAQYNALQQEKVLVTADATNQITALSKQMIEQQKAENYAYKQNLVATFTSTLNAASSILSAIQSGIDTTNKDGFEKNKKLQIANAHIAMLVGITNALAGAFTSKSGTWDWVLAGIQAAGIATSGAIQIDNIKKQKFDGSGSVGSVGVTPNVSTVGNIPIQYTKELLTDTETAEMNKGNRIYVVESDISETQNEVAVKEANSSF